MNQPKLLVHNKNEIPLFLGPNKEYLTLDTYYGESVGEVKIPLKVVKFNVFLKKKTLYVLGDSGHIS